MASPSRPAGHSTGSPVTAAGSKSKQASPQSKIIRTKTSTRFPSMGVTALTRKPMGSGSAGAAAVGGEHIVTYSSTYKGGQCGVQSYLPQAAKRGIASVHSVKLLHPDQLQMQVPRPGQMQLHVPYQVVTASHHLAQPETSGTISLRDCNELENQSNRRLRGILEDNRSALQALKGQVETRLKQLAECYQAKGQKALQGFNQHMPQRQAIDDRLMKTSKKQLALPAPLSSSSSQTLAPAAESRAAVSRKWADQFQWSTPKGADKRLYTVAESRQRDGRELTEQQRAQMQQSREREEQQLTEGFTRAFESRQLPTVQDGSGSKALVRAQSSVVCRSLQAHDDEAKVSNFKEALAAQSRTSVAALDAHSDFFSLKIELNTNAFFLRRRVFHQMRNACDRKVEDFRRLYKKLPHRSLWPQSEQKQEEYSAIERYLERQMLGRCNDRWLKTIDDYHDEVDNSCRQLEQSISKVGKQIRSCLAGSYDKMDRHLTDFIHFRSPKDHEIKEAHEVLGVDQDASEREIRDAYLSKVKQCHPDSPQRDTTMARQLEFTELAAAYEVLTGKRDY